MMHRALLAIVALTCLGAVPPRPAAFDIVPLGVEGGIVDGATTAYVIAAHGRQRAWRAMRGRWSRGSGLRCVVVASPAKPVRHGC